MWSHIEYYVFDMSFMWLFIYMKFGGSMISVLGMFGSVDGLRQKLSTWERAVDGSYSSVYYVSDTLVVKVTNDVAYLKFAEFISDNRDLQHLPKIHDKIVSGNLTYLLMDKLYNIEDEQLSIMNITAENAGWYEKDAEVWMGIVDTLDTTLTKLVEFWNVNYERYGLQWDLHDGNMMQDINGGLVILDPWCK